MIRDALVEKIWEGTPNIMALDVVRACRDGRSGVAFVDVSATLTRFAAGALGMGLIIDVCNPVGEGSPCASSR